MVLAMSTETPRITNSVGRRYDDDDTYTKITLRELALPTKFSNEMNCFSLAVIQCQHAFVHLAVQTSPAHSSITPVGT